MKKILLISLMLLLVLSGCDKDTKEPIPESLTSDWNIESYVSFLNNGTRIKDILTIADVINSEDIKGKFDLNINFMNEVEQTRIATLNLKCLTYSDEYKTCIKGSEKLQVNGKPIIIYEGAYSTSETVTRKFNSYLRLDGEYIYYLNSIGFYEMGNVGLYDLNGNKIMGESNAIEKYFTTNLELIDTYPTIKDNYFVYYTCDVEKEKINKHEYNLSTNIGSITDTVDGYCNVKQPFFYGNKEN